MALTVDHLRIVRAELFKARTKWYDIGLELKVPVTTLDCTEGQFGNHSDKLRETLKVWLKTATEPSWQDVVGVLKSPVVGEPKLASDIKTKYCITAETGQASGPTMPEVQQAAIDQLQQQLQQVQQQVQQQQQATEERERQVRELTEQLQQMKRSGPPPQKPVMQQKAIHNMKWKDKSKAPVKMRRGSAATDANRAYFNGWGHTTVHSYDSDTQEWCRPPDAPHTQSSLVMVHHILTMVGGLISGRATNSLLSLMGEGKGEKWLPNLPAMPTKRCFTAVVCSGRSLVVAGGSDGSNRLATVEVLDTDARQWSIASSLTHPFTSATISVCDERLYMLGGFDQIGNETRSVLSCSVPELLQSCQTQPLAGKLQTAPVNKSTIWRHVADAPHTVSSCATLCGQLVAIGGSEAGENSSAITGYNETTDSWEAIGIMPTARRRALVATLNGKLMVVGGDIRSLTETDVVEILC